MRRILFFCFGLSIGFTRLNAQVIEPYLQSPTDTSVWVTWKTNADEESKVFYGEDSTSMSEVATGSCQVLSDIGYSDNYFYHAVRLTGLEPDHFYYYRAVSGSRSSFAYRFRTQPQKGQSAGKYRFLVFGDHQIKTDDRYERLLKAAREKVADKFGGNIEDHINLVINDGDQVDEGTLDQYEHVHFGPSAYLSGNIPFMTTVGNHESYGSIGLPLYYKHFFYDDVRYKGIISPGGENYYAYQQKDIVFIHLSSEHPVHEQKLWVQQIIDSVKADTTVSWVVSIAHRPIQAEQYVGDISLYVRDSIVPVLAQTEKSVLMINGHHHLYARGQVRDYPMYHMISGGGSWDQYWGQATEMDFDDVQKTIDNWSYQIVTFDAATKAMTVESYAIGGPKQGLTINNELIDSFSKRQNIMPPEKPSIITVPDDTITLPYVFIGSPYVTNTSLPYNSVQFQVSLHEDFNKCVVDLIRDFENLYGTTGSPDYLPVDIHKNLDIFRYEVHGIPNGPYFIRTRYRDRNIEWSEWSDPVNFTVKGSVGGFTSISTDKKLFLPDETITINYQFGPGNSKDWIGIYKTGDIPGSTPSIHWGYVNGTSGSLNLNISEPGQFFIAFFENDGYRELADRITVYVTSTPTLALSKPGYENSEDVLVSYSNSVILSYDWIGIYRISDTPGVMNATLWKYITGPEGEIVFTGLPDGYYFVTYFLNDGYTEACERIIFSVGSDLASVNVDRATYQTGQSVAVGFENGPGTKADWIGLLRQNTPPGTAPLVGRQFIENRHAGSVQFNLEMEAGEYYAALFINNSSIRVSNKADFIVESAISNLDETSGKESFILFPSPSSGKFNLLSSGFGQDKVTVRISTMAGHIIFDKEFEFSPGMHSEEIDLSGASSGTYLISLKTGERLFLDKLVIQ